MDDSNIITITGNKCFDFGYLISLLGNENRQLVKIQLTEIDIRNRFAMENPSIDSIREKIYKSIELVDIVTFVDIKNIEHILKN